MDFVNVTGSIPWSRIRLGDDITGASVNLTQRSLVSLIGGLRQKEAGPDTLLYQVYEIQEYRRRYCDPCNGKLYIDSGGYSIISGEVEPEFISKTIDAYHLVPKHYQNDFDYLFTLDIPVVLTHPSVNTKANLYRLNLKSLAATKRLLEQSQQLQAKVVFVWQFKIPGQYEIWKTIYKELGLNNYIQNRAIGGLVGLHQALRNAGRSIDFSPVIALPFRCLLDHLNKKDVDKEFRLHFLGVKIRSDRFVIALVEQLFGLYLHGISEVQFTYDSINYNTSAMYGSKILVNCWSFFKGNLDHHENVLSIPDNILRNVYHTDQLYKHLIKELGHIKRGEPLENSDMLSPLNIYSNIELDTYFSHIIRNYDLAGIIYRSKSIFEVYPHLKHMLKELKVAQPRIFTNNLTKQIEESVDVLYKFHEWYCKRRDYESLDELIELFIKMINFPMVLQ